MKRKLSSFLAFFLAFMTGSVFAQSFSADKTYVISNRNDVNLFMQDNDGGVVALGGMTSSSYWRLIATGKADCYYVQNATTEKYMQSTAGMEVEVALGDTPVEICILDCSADEGEGMYGMASTDQETYNFTAGTIGANWKNNNTVQGFAAVSGTNHRSFWKIAEAEMPQPVVQLSSPYTGAELAQGDFFIYNVETGLWLQNNEKNTGDWNTRGASGDYGFDFAISPIEGGWQLNPKFGHNNSMNIGNFYLDTGDGVSTWTLEPAQVEGVSNAYIIKGNDQTLGLDGSNNMAWTSDKSVWQLVTREERIAYMQANASEENPIDATFLIQDPGFANENLRRNAWEWQRDGGNLDDVRWYRNRRSYAVWNTNSFSIKQTLANVPNGKYALTFKGYYRDGDRDQVIERRAAGEERLIAKYFINEDKANVMSILDGASQNWVDGLFYYPAPEAEAPYGHYPDNADAFNRIFQDYPEAYLNTGVTSVVTTGTITIGIEKLEKNERDWLAFDDFRLTYLGNTIDLSEYITGLQTAIDEALAFDASATSDVLAEQLAQAVADGQSKLSSTDPDEISAASAAISAALLQAKAVNTTVLKQTADLAEGEGLDVAAARQAVAEATEVAQLEQPLFDLRAARKIKALGMPDIYTGSAPAEGKVYIFNLGTGLFLGTGSDWNTHAAVDQVGIEIELIAEGDNFKMKTNRGGGWLNYGGYVDTGAQDVWHFLPVEGKENVYNISSTGEDGFLLGYDANGRTDGRKYWSTIAIDRTGLDNPMNQWKIITEAEREQLIEKAADNAPVDVSYLIKNASLNRQDGYDMWQKECNGGNGGARVSTVNDNNGDRAADYAWEYYEPESFSFTQEISDLKPGKYQVSVQGFFRNGNGDAQAAVVNEDGELKQLAYLVANEQQAFLPNIASVLSKVPGIGDLRSTNKGEFPNMPQSAIEYFETGYYKTVIAEVVVDLDGMLTIGVKKDTKEQNGDWVVFDNFRLTYFGTTPLITAKTDLAEAIAAAEALNTDEYTAESVAALSEAIAAAKEALNAEDATLESLEAAKTALQDAVAGLELAPIELPEGTLYAWQAGHEGGGKAVASDGQSVYYPNAGYKTIRLNGAKDYSTNVITITLDEPLNAGDTIKVTAYRNKNVADKTSGFKAKFDKGGEVASSTGLEFVNIDTSEGSEGDSNRGTTPNTCEFIVPAEAAGSNVITITRSHTGTNLFIVDLTITKTDAELVAAKQELTDEIVKAENLAKTEVDDEAANKALADAIADAKAALTASDATVASINAATEALRQAEAAFQDVATGIAQINAEMNAGKVYDLQGRKVTGTIVKGNTYIINGKKTMVK